MVRDNLSSYKNLYIQTAQEYLRSIMTALQELQHAPENKELINQIYIASHSLKSQSIVMGFTHTGFLCHTIEYLFHEIKEGKILISLPLLSLVLAAVKKVEESIDSIEKNDKEINQTQHIRALEKIILQYNHL